MILSTLILVCDMALFKLLQSLQIPEKVLIFDGRINRNSFDLTIFKHQSKDKDT